MRCAVDHGTLCAAVCSVQSVESTFTLYPAAIGTTPEYQVLNNNYPGTWYSKNKNHSSTYVLRVCLLLLGGLRAFRSPISTKRRAE